MYHVFELVMCCGSLYLEFSLYLPIKWFSITLLCISMVIRWCIGLGEYFYSIEHSQITSLYVYAAKQQLQTFPLPLYQLNLNTKWVNAFFSVTPGGRHSDIRPLH